MTTTIHTTRPRNVNSWRAAALLYGDLGSSKVYVLGIAFALAGYASFWYILAVSFLTLLVGFCYTLICRYYPSGGGVYASVRDRSHVLAMIGAFFLISDYIITAALSALSAFHYLGVAHPESWAIVAIIINGLLNYLGPKQTGSLAIFLAIPMIVCVILLGLLSIPFLSQAIHHLPPISTDWNKNWNIFVGIIVALSGIESIANTTSTMKLDPGYSYKNPSVAHTSTPAIMIVIFEVCFFTTLFGLAMNALSGLEISGGQVSAPGYPNVRDAMLRYMGEVFAGTLFGAAVGKIFGIILSVVVTLLLLSAVNTAIVALSSLLFVMSRDSEIPSVFQKLNRFGVPFYGSTVAFLVPILILFWVHDILGLANLYAIGFVGAITVNLGATSTNLKLPLKLWQRLLMLGTSLFMLAVEITLFIDKPDARNYVITIMFLGLLLRAIVAEQKEKELLLPEEKTELKPIPPQTKGDWMVAVNGINRSLDFAIKECKERQIPLHILFVREQKVIFDPEEQSPWMNDREALNVYNYVVSNAPEQPVEFLYTVTAHSAHSIAEIAKMKNVDSVVIEKTKKAFFLLHTLRGTTSREVAKQLPENTKLIIY